MAFKLKFISGKYQGGEFRLQDNSEAIIGRSSDIDIVLVEDMVSRRHAKIEVQGDIITLTDFGSTNGSYVNGERITQSCPLKEGDKILVGTSIIQLVKDDPPAESTDQTEVAVRDALTPVELNLMIRMSGDSTSTNIFELLTSFNTKKESGILAVLGDDGQGQVFIKEGRIVYAFLEEVQELGPKKALFRILSWEDFEFHLLPLKKTEFIADEIKDDPAELIAEAQKQYTHLNKIRVKLPEKNSTLKLAEPIIPLLRNLTPELLDILQLIYNYKHLKTVINKSVLTDLETYRYVLQLIKNGYVSLD